MNEIPRPNPTDVHIDEGTAEVLSQIEALEGDAEKQIRLAIPEPDEFAEFLLQTGLVNDPEAMRILEMAKEAIQGTVESLPQSSLSTAPGTIDQLSADLAIDFGAANTRIYASGKGIVVDEPSVVAIDKHTGDVTAVGHEAVEQVTRTPEFVKGVRPLKKGFAGDFKLAQTMFQYFIDKAHGSDKAVSARCIVGVPSELTGLENRIVADSTHAAGARTVYLVDDSAIAGIGAGLAGTAPSGRMVVDVGGATTNIAVVSSTGTVSSRSVRAAGDEMDEAVVQHMRRKYNLLIGERTAEAIKKEIGSALPLVRPHIMEIKGRNLIVGTPVTVAIDDSEIRDALEESVSAIVNAIREALEGTTPSLRAGIAAGGIVLTGGGALLTNLDKRIRAETGIPVSIADDPMTSGVRGGALLLTEPAMLDRFATAYSYQ